MEVGRTHFITLDPRLGDFNGEWVNINMSAMHKKYCITISTDIQNCTKCWRVGSTPQLYAKTQLSGCALPADVRQCAASHSHITQT